MPAYQFYDNGSADTGVRAADLPALGPEVVGLHFGSYSLAAAPVADAMAALARGKAGRFVSVDPNVRPTVEPDMDVWRERLAVLFPLADLVKISAEDLELLWPGMAAGGAGGGLIATGVGLVVVTDGGEAAHGLDKRRASCDGDAAAGEGRRHGRGRRHLPGGAAGAASARSRGTEGGAGGAGREGGSRRSSTMPRGPRRSPARGAGPTCRAPPN